MSTATVSHTQSDTNHVPRPLRIICSDGIIDTTIESMSECRTIMDMPNDLEMTVISLPWTREILETVLWAADSGFYVKYVPKMPAPWAEPIDDLIDEYEDRPPRPLRRAILRPFLEVLDFLHADGDVYKIYSTVLAAHAPYYLQFPSLDSMICEATTDEYNLGCMCGDDLDILLKLTMKPDWALIEQMIVYVMCSELITAAYEFQNQQTVSMSKFTARAVDAIKILSGRTASRSDVLTHLQFTPFMHRNPVLGAFIWDIENVKGTDSARPIDRYIPPFKRVTLPPIPPDPNIEYLIILHRRIKLNFTDGESAITWMRRDITRLFGDMSLVENTTDPIKDLELIVPIECPQNIAKWIDGLSRIFEILAIMEFTLIDNFATLPHPKINHATDLSNWWKVLRYWHEEIDETVKQLFVSMNHDRKMHLAAFLPPQFHKLAEKQILSGKNVALDVILSCRADDAESVSRYCRFSAACEFIRYQSKKRHIPVFEFYRCGLELLPSEIGCLLPRDQK